MKKTLKIIGITLACLVGLVLVAAIVALSTVTSSKQLTKLAKKYIPELVTFDVQLEKANLTLVKTFPDIGLELNNVAILSPMEDAPTDTLARVEHLILSANARKFLKEKQILVNRCLLENSDITLFTDEEGHSNLDIFKSQKEDTTSKPFDYAIDLKEVQLKNTNLAYIDLRSPLLTEVKGMDLDIQGQMKDDDIDAVLALKAQQAQLTAGSLSGDLRQLALNFDGRMDDYQRIDGTLTVNTPDGTLNAGYEVLHHDTLKLSLPVALRFDTLEGNLHDASLGLNDILLSIDQGTFSQRSGDLALDADFHTNSIDLETVLKRLPEKVAQSLQGIQFQGRVALADGKVAGVVNDSLLPRVTATVTASDALINVPQLPYPFKDLDLSTQLDLDLNDSLNAHDVQLSTTWGHTKLKATGAVTDLSRQLAMNLDLNGDMPLTDLKPFLPKTMGLKGKADVKLKTQGTLDDLMAAVTKYQFRNRLRADGTVTLRDFAFDMDTLHAAAPKLLVTLGLPASRRIKGRNGAYLALSGNTLNVKAGNSVKADLQELNLQGTADQLNKGLQALQANADVSIGQLDLTYDTITVHASQPILTAETAPGKRNGLHVNAALKTGALDAKAGPEYHLNATALALTATADEDPGKKDGTALQHWNPTADFVLTQATLDVPQLDKTIEIPTIDFVADAHEIGFRRGGVKIGKSDLTLEGNVLGLDKWLATNAESQNSGAGKANTLLNAELQVHSHYLDVNEIMDLTSGMGAKDTRDEEVTNKDDNPFMVPLGVDFTFGIHADKALYRNLELNNLGGTATVKDGTLMLQEIGFTNEAAEMQLTAIYQSPRKNHLFLGLDFHLLDVQIHDLLHIIPEIDTLVPMLKTFDGAAEFHIAAQTNLKSNYDLKMSSLRASADIEGANLSVRDIASFTKITDMLKVSTNGEYKIDSIDIQMTAFRDEVDLWPFQVCLGKYKATLDGHYNLNTVGEYHISITDSPLPTRLGLKINGPLDNLSYSLEPCKYPNLYKPSKRNDTEQLVMQLKQQIAAKLKENVQ